MLNAVVQGLINTGVAAEQAWTTVNTVVAENRAPTAEDWAAACSATT